MAKRMRRFTLDYSRNSREWTHFSQFWFSLPMPSLVRHAGYTFA
jgi:hypothetical protein